MAMGVLKIGKAKWAGWLEIEGLPYYIKIFLEIPHDAA